MYPYPEWQVHRGYHLAGAKENTLEAMAAAFSGGGQMIECDVRINKFGELFLSHDENLQRVFNLATDVYRTPLSELKKMGVPSLYDLLDSFGNYFLNIELKHEKHGMINKVKSTLAYIEELNLEEKVLISSFDPFLLRLVKLMQPKQKTALIFNDTDKVDSLRFKSLDAIAGSDYWHLCKDQIGERVSSDFKKPCAVWTVNDYGLAKTLKAKGFSSVISDKLPE